MENTHLFAYLILSIRKTPMFIIIDAFWHFQTNLKMWHPTLVSFYIKLHRQISYCSGRKFYRVFKNALDAAVTLESPYFYQNVVKSCVVCSSFAISGECLHFWLQQAEARSHFALFSKRGKCTEEIHLVTTCNVLNQCR